jgi:tetratricopeptide (TPR) repeat protein
MEVPSRPFAFALSATCAAARKDWPAAARRWRICVDRFPGKIPAAFPGLAHALTELGQPDEARAAWEAAHAAAPRNPWPIASLAALAAGRGEHQAAIDFWRRAIALDAGTPHPHWEVGIARMLLASGDAPAALDAARAILRASPGFQPALMLMAYLLKQMNRRDEARVELAHGVFAEGAPGAMVHRLGLLARMADLDSVRSGLAEACAGASSVEELTGLLGIIPLVHEPGDCIVFWRTLRQRLAAIGGDDAASHCLAMRLDLALGDEQAFLAHYDGGAVVPPKWQARFDRLARALRDPRDVHDAPKVFCIGLSKTGTATLHEALERLGLLAAHFYDPFTLVMLTPAHARRFDAMSDIPVCACFEQLYATYPNARFIWTRRDQGAWLDSFNRQSERMHGSADFAVLRAQCRNPTSKRHGAGLAAIDYALFFQYSDAITAAQAFDARVEAFFADKPVGKLLRIDVCAGEGWEILCPFLEVAEPDTPFPWENKSLKG